MCHYSSLMCITHAVPLLSLDSGCLAPDEDRACVRLWLLYRWGQGLQDPPGLGSERVGGSAAQEVGDGVLPPRAGQIG